MNRSRVRWDKQEFIDFVALSQNIARGRDPRGLSKLIVKVAIRSLEKAMASSK